MFLYFILFHTQFVFYFCEFSRAVGHSPSPVAETKLFSIFQNGEFVYRLYDGSAGISVVALHMASNAGNIFHLKNCRFWSMTGHTRIETLTVKCVLNLLG